MKKSRKWNLLKTLLFTILLTGWDIRNHKIFHLKIIKNHACSPNLFFDASNDRKYQKVIKLASKWGTQNPWKIIKNPPWDLPGSLCVHLWPTWLQNGAKMVPKDLQMDPKWSSADPKSSKKTIKSNNQLYNKQFFFFMFIHWFNPGNQFFYSCQSFQSANQQSTGYQRGRRQGRSLKNIWTVRSIYKLSSSTYGSFGPSTSI